MFKKIIKTAKELEISAMETGDVLLGDWCLSDLADDLQIFKEKKIAKYHWEDSNKFFKDQVYLEDLYERVLNVITVSLNSLHCTNYPVRYWRIIIGPWLRFFIDAVFDRFESVKFAHYQYPNHIFISSKRNIIDPPKDFQGFYQSFVKDAWNEDIFSDALEFQKIPCISQNYSKSSDGSENIIRTKLFGGWLRSLGYQIQSLFLNLTHKIFIYDPYIPIRRTLQLHGALRSPPNLFKKVVSNIDLSHTVNLRKKFIVSFAQNNFEKFLENKIIDSIPIIYVEGYHEFKNIALKSFPKNTKLIYTANAYQSDDLFKFWVSEMSNNGSKFCIGQHGGTFGIARHSQTESHQIKIADYFFSWGWKIDSYDNILPMPSLRFEALNEGLKLHHNNGKILHVLGSVPQFFYHSFSMPIAGQYKFYIDDQIKFLENLDYKTLNKTLIRPDYSGRGWGWNIEKYLNKAGFQDQITPENCPLLKQIKGSSLCVCTHNGTIFLEMAAINFPFIVFWNKNLYPIRASAIQIFEELFDNNIFFDSPKEAAFHVNKVANDVMGWWLESGTQNAIINLRENYAQNDNNKIEIWKNRFEESLIH